jgi:hypothetical protein
LLNQSFNFYLRQKKILSKQNGTAPCAFKHTERRRKGGEKEEKKQGPSKEGWEEGEIEGFMKERDYWHEVVKGRIDNLM